MIMRFFNFAYTGLTDKGQIYGDYCCEIGSNHFPPRELLVSEIVGGDRGSVIKPETIVILSFFEFRNKSDFEDFKTKYVGCTSSG